MKKNENQFKNAMKSFGSMVASLFIGGKAKQKKTGKSLLEEEAISSPGRTAVRNFFRNKLAVTGLIAFVVLMLVVFVGGNLKPYDTYYTQGVLRNIAPGYGYMKVPKELTNEGIDTISSGITFSVGLSNEGNVYVWGKDNSGVLTIPEEVKNQKIVQAVAGDRHIIVLTEDGEILGWGNNNFNQTILKTELSKPAVRNYVAEGIKKIGAGDGYSMFITEEGNIHVWGSVLANNLGMIPDRVKDANVVDFVAQSLNVTLLLDDGTIDGIGVVGNPVFSSISEELKDGTINVVDIAMVSDGGVALDDQGNLHSWGSSISQARRIPENIEGKVVSITNGRNHFVAITEDGKAFGWGENKYGQADVPTSLTNVDTVYSDFFQNYAINEDGKVTTWGNDGFLLGTDDQGRDLFGRLLEGGKITLTVGAVAVVIQVVIGVIVGMISGFYGGRIDNLLMRFAEIVSSFPFYPLVITLSATLPYNISQQMRLFMVMLILGVIGWPGIARLVRGQILSEREKDFVLAAKALGIKEKNIIIKHILPNVINIIIVQMTLGYAGNLLTEAGLSFLGFGVVSPYASWGNMLTGSQSTTVMEVYWWRWVFPALAVFIAALTINLVGDGIRDALDPKANEK